MDATARRFVSSLARASSPRVALLVAASMLSAGCPGPRYHLLLQNQSGEDLQFRYRRTDTGRTWTVEVPRDTAVYLAPPPWDEHKDKDWLLVPGYELCTSGGRTSVCRTSSDFHWVDLAQGAHEREFQFVLTREDIVWVMYHRARKSAQPTEEPGQAESESHPPPTGEK